ncbi:dgkA [Mytilus coruscus]|uniref:DgkA n=1 Tax=Mytilus coruscus TaxID=42192 RepID=A0A6J8DY82_MYTCO|nr:dgkA [Mytilus coruscus]
MSVCQDLGACGALLYLKMSVCQNFGACGALLYLKMSDCQDLGACGTLLFPRMSDCQDLGACGALLFPRMSDCQDLGACGALLFLNMSDSRSRCLWCIIVSHDECLTNKPMSEINMTGKKNKHACGGSSLFEIIRDAIVTSHECATETTIWN